MCPFNSEWFGNRAAFEMDQLVISSHTYELL